MIDLLIRLGIELIQVVTALFNMAAAKENYETRRRNQGRKTRKSGYGRYRKSRS